LCEDGLILYLHGFRSSPNSRKAQYLLALMRARGLAGDYLCPQLPASPRAAAEIALVAAQLEPTERLALIGSSLGGYYATWVAERLGCRAVLLNPAIRPYEDLKAYLGRQSVFYSNASIDMKPEYLDELLALDVPTITRPERYFLIAATGDQVIDWRTMADRYPDCRKRVIEGSDHELSDFAQYADEVLAFCGVH
jgi:predicted esterase YcpF (UPF0227 family)